MQAGSSLVAPPADLEERVQPDHAGVAAPPPLSIERKGKNAASIPASAAEPAVLDTPLQATHYFVAHAILSPGNCGGEQGLRHALNEAQDDSGAALTPSSASDEAAGLEVSRSCPHGCMRQTA